MADDEQGVKDEKDVAEQGGDAAGSATASDGEGAAGAEQEQDAGGE
jgi:hypothetical protein